MTVEAGGDISVREGILKDFNFRLSYSMLKTSHNGSLRPSSHHNKLDNEM